MLCRGCGGSVPKHRQTWCSERCYNARCPARVNLTVKKRDGGKCQFCAYDFASERNKYYAQRRIGKTNWRPRKENYDHIIPHSEGGAHIVENIRLLCDVCHKERTAKWLAEKAQARRAKSQPRLFPAESASAPETGGVLT